MKFTLTTQEKYDTIIDNVMEHIDEIVVIFDEKGNLKKMNSLCDQLLPFKRSEVEGKNINYLVDRKLVVDPIILEMIDTREKVFKDIVYPGGKIISYTAIPRYDADGNFQGGVLTGRDVSRIVNLMRGTTKADDEVEYISASKSIDDIKKIIKTISSSDASVFILGESGTGKEIIARMVYSTSYRADKPFIAINCASIPQDLIESELFGYEPGSFTGARKDGKVGLIELAHEGTLFLDEIGELPLETQKKILRVCQEKSIMRLGGVESIDVDVRFICATNKTYEEIKNPKIFRQDLYYRLGVIPITVPPLRNRKEDIIPITQYYVDRFNQKYNRNVQLTEGAMKILLANDWPGNIRELKNVIERLVILSAFEQVDQDMMARIMGLENIADINEQHSCSIERNGECLDDQPLCQKGLGPICIDGIMDIDEAHRIVEQKIISKAIKKYGNVTKAAEAIGINPSTIYRKIKTGYLEIDLQDK